MCYILLLCKCAVFEKFARVLCGPVKISVFVIVVVVVVVVVVVALPFVCLNPFCLFSLPTPSSLVTSLFTTAEEREFLGGVEDDGHRLRVYVQ